MLAVKCVQKALTLALAWHAAWRAAGNCRRACGILALFLALGQHSRRRTVHETVGVDHIASRPQSNPDVKPGTTALEWDTIAL